MPTDVRAPDSSSAIARGAAPAPPRYKIAALTWVAIYPLVLGLSMLLARLGPGLPPALSILFVTLGTVLLATYAAVPALSRLFRRWLVPGRDPSTIERRGAHDRQRSRPAASIEPLAKGRGPRLVSKGPPLEDGQQHQPLNGFGLPMGDWGFHHRRQTCQESPPDPTLRKRKPRQSEKDDGVRP